MGEVSFRELRNKKQLSASVVLKTIEEQLGLYSIPLLLYCAAPTLYRLHLRGPHNTSSQQTKCVLPTTYVPTYVLIDYLQINY